MAPPDDYRLEAPVVYYLNGPPTPAASRVSDVFLNVRPGALIVVAPANRGRAAGLAASRRSRAVRYSRAIIAAASRSRSTYGAPLTSTATRLIVPPVNTWGCAPGYSPVTGSPLSRPTHRPSPAIMNLPG
jgi:hypothetical protein